MGVIDFQGYYNDALGLFGGNVSYLRLVFIGVIVWLGWGHWASIFASAKKAITHFIAEFKTLKQPASPSTASAPVTYVAQPVEDPLSSLQAMTTWAVRSGTPEVLSKVTALYQDLQAAGKGSK